MTKLHFDVTADCSSAVAALSNTESAIDHLSGKAASVSVSVHGASAAVNDLGMVTAAASQVSSEVRVGADTRELAAAQRSASSLRSEVQGLSRDMGQVGGLDVPVGGSSGIRGITGELGGLSRQLENVGGGGSRSMRELDSGVRDTSRSLESGARTAAGMESALGGAGGAAEKAGGRFQGLSDKIGDFLGKNAEVAHAMYDPSLGGALNPPAGGQYGSGGLIGARQGLSPPGTPSAAQYRSQAQDRLAKRNDALAKAESEGADVGPPEPPMGSGSPSSSPRRRPRPPRRGPPEDLGDEGFGEGLGKGGAGGVGSPPLMMGAIVGGVGELVAAAAGIVGVAEAIKQVPDLAGAASRAMGGFDRSVRQAAQGATAAGIPALQQLGAALRPLGTEVGQIGAAQMATALGAATTLAGTTTTALKNLEPAIGPAISGLAALAGSVISGVSSPQAVKGIKELGQTLQDPANEAGIKNLTSGVTTLGTIAAQVLTDTAGAIGQMTGMGGEAAQAPLVAAGLGAFLGKGKPGGAMAGGLLFGAGALRAQQLQDQGKSPTDALSAEFGGAGLAAATGAFGGGARGMAVGGLLGLGAQAGVSALGPGGMGLLSESATSKASGAVAGALNGAALGAYLGSMIGPEGTLIGAGLGAIGGGIAGYMTAPDSQYTADNAGGAGADYSQWGRLTQSAPQGWDKDAAGKLTPSTGPTDKAGSPALTPGPPLKVPPPSPRSEFGSSLGQPISPSAIAQLNSGTNQLSSSMTSLSQNSTTAAASQTQLAGQSTTAAARVSQVPAAVKPMMDALSTVAPQTSTALSAASTSISTSSEAMGTQVPASMASGVKANTGVACDATKQLSNSAINCGASALQASSPSKVFVELGEGIGQGLSIGVKAGTPGAVAAVNQAMSSVVSAGASGLGAASPSKTFEAMGANLMSGAPGSGSAPPPPGGSASPPSGSGAAAQGALAAARAQTAAGAKLRAETEKFNQEAAAPGGSGARAADPGGNAIQYGTDAMNRIAGHNLKAAKLRADVLERHQDAMYAVQHGMTPNQARAEREQAKQAEEARGPAPGPSMADRAGDFTRNWISNQAFGPRLPTGTPGTHEGPANVAGDVVHGAVAAVAAVGHATKNLITQNLGTGESAGMSLLRGLGSAMYDSQTQLMGNLTGQGQKLGAAVPQSMTAGINKNQGAVASAASNSAQGAVSATKKKLNSDSPSLVFAQIGADVVTGFAMGVSGGATGAQGATAAAVTGVLTGATSAARGVANTAGLAVGFSYAESLVTGAQHVLRSADFVQLGFPQVQSPNAKAALGAAGLLGAAGAGAQSYQLSAREVSMGSGSAALPTPPPITVNVSLDGHPFDQKIVTANNALLTAITNSLTRQRAA